MVWLNQPSLSRSKNISPVFNTNPLRLPAICQLLKTNYYFFSLSLILQAPVIMKNTLRDVIEKVLNTSSSSPGFYISRWHRLISPRVNSDEALLFQPYWKIDRRSETGIGQLKPSSPPGFGIGPERMKRDCVIRTSKQIG